VVKTMNLVLASQSPRRRELLALTGLSFEVVPTRTDERRQPGESPADYARRVSGEKARDAARQTGDPVLVLAADTIVVDGDDVLGKPRDGDDAAAILRQLRGRVHHVYTAVSLLDTATGRQAAALADSPVQMRDYDDAEVAAYVASGDPFDKAGAYAIQNTDFRPVAHFEHCFANVMGLPLCHVTKMLRRWGNAPPADVPAACQAHLAYRCPVYAAILVGEEP
jgi:septum formation protein